MPMSWIYRPLLLPLAGISLLAVSAVHADDCVSPVLLGDKPSMSSYADYDDFLVAAIEYRAKEEEKNKHQKMCPQLYKEADRKSTRLNSSHVRTSYAVSCLKKKMTLLLKRYLAPSRSMVTGGSLQAKMTRDIPAATICLTQVTGRDARYPHCTSALDSVACR